MFEHPAIAFSPWVRWSDRHRLVEERPFLGVYLWAHFHHEPDPTIPPTELRLPEELIYAGETKT
jgi:hypothetical protein